MMMAEKQPSILIEPSELWHLLSNPTPEKRHVFLFDATWLGLPSFNGRQGAMEFEKLRLPGAEFFDIDVCCDSTSGLPHMLPPRDVFTTYLQHLCVHDARSCVDTPVDRATAEHNVSTVDLRRDLFVVYDTLGAWSAPRVWWMLRYFGAENVRILHGGLGAWLTHGYTVDDRWRSHMPAPSHTELPSIVGVSTTPSLVASRDDVAAVSQTSQGGGRDQHEPGSILIMDARPQGRFLGKDPEPRPGLPSGAIPGSVNVPWDSVLCKHGYRRHRSTLSGDLSNTSDEVIHCTYFTFKAPEELVKVLAPHLRDRSTCLVTCGSGVSSVILLVAIFLSGSDVNVQVYDGSWVDWVLSSRHTV